MSETETHCKIYLIFDGACQLVGRQQLLSLLEAGGGLIVCPELVVVGKLEFPFLFQFAGDVMVMDCAICLAAFNL